MSEQSPQRLAIESGLKEVAVLVQEQVEALAGLARVLGGRPVRCVRV